MSAVVSFLPNDARTTLSPTRVAPWLDAANGTTPPFLNDLRFVGLRCRAARRVAAIEACQLLAGSGARGSALELLMRSLPQALGKAPVLFAPGAKELSFDEAWLLQLSRALEHGDSESAAFLLRSRVPVHARRSLAFLLRAALLDGLLE